MSVIGPRPQLVRDMVFMSKEQRMRHTAKPGLSGLAQVNGRNAISWEDKMNWDLKYIKKVTFKEDLKIILDTVKKAFIKQEGITQDDMATAEDLGDYLLRTEKVDQSDYQQKQQIAKNILSGEDGIEREEGLVSIIMPSYNTAPYIKQTIQSVLNQTYTNWELIIVDDCSTDNTEEILEEINDNRIRCFKNEVNSGAAVSRNKALREAKGQWIAFLDSDDLWLPTKLEKQIEFMNRNKYSFSYTNYEEIDVDGNDTGVKVTGPKRITKTGMFNYCWPGCLTAMYNASKIGLIQIHDIKKNNDYEGMPNTVVEAQATGLPCIISDTITRQSNITGLVDFLSIDLPAEDWAEKCVNHNKKRVNTTNILQKSGYNIDIIVKDFLKMTVGDKCDNKY